MTNLSYIDGAIGDGDHGVNMNRGFSLCADAIDGRDLSFSDTLMILGKTLLGDIGDSIGPLYGGFFKAFKAMSAAVKELPV